MWSLVPYEILEMILIILDLAEIASVAAVCRTWRGAARWFAAERRLSVRHLPWLIPTNNPKSQIINLLKPRGGDRQPIAARHRCCGVYDEWLILVDEQEGPYIFHPLLHDRISLPSQSTLPMNIPVSEFSQRWQQSPYFIHKVILSASPISSECTIATIFGDEELAYCRLGDAAWSEIEPGWWRERHYDDIVFYNDELYAVDKTETVWAFRLGEAGMVARRAVIHLGCFWLEPNAKSRYLMVLQHRLVMVVRNREVCRWNGCRFKPALTVDFQIFEFEINGRRWAKLWSLGDRLMFLSRSMSILIPAEEISQQFGTNRIYFTEDGITNSREPIDMGIFLIDGQRFIQWGAKMRDPLFFFLFNYSSLF